MKVKKISKNVWEIEFDDYINISNYFKTTGDILMKLGRLEKDMHKMLQNIFDLQKMFKEVKKTDGVAYLETFIEEKKNYIKGKKSRSRRKIVKKDDCNENKSKVTQKE